MGYKLTKRILNLIILLSFGLSVSGQLERNGIPLSWSIGSESAVNSSWRVIPGPDAAQLMAEDEQMSADRTQPFRFAHALDVALNMGNSGQWTSLRNGDRLWILGIESPGSYSLGLTLSRCVIPRGARVFIYSEDRSDYIGPIGSDEFLSDTLGIPHISGSRVVIEYYEPYNNRGTGIIEIAKVARAYRDLKIEAGEEASDCLDFLNWRSDQTDLSDISSSVMLMMVDFGQRLATATLLNNSKADATPFAITASSALSGPPSSWTFQFGLVRDNCRSLQSACALNTICGAKVVRTDVGQGISLLKLMSSPRNNWETYYSGYRIQPDDEASSLVCIQHAKGLVQSTVRYSGVLSPSNQGSQSTMSLSGAISGQTYQGSIGSPLFDDEMNLVGIFTGGDLHCNEDGGMDHFAMFCDSWPAFKGYLDPFATVDERINGFFARTNSELQSNGSMDISFYPNPTSDMIFIRNDEKFPLDEIILHDGSGRLVARFRPDKPIVSLSHLPEGIYLVTFIAGGGQKSQKLLIR